MVATTMAKGRDVSLFEAACRGGLRKEQCLLFRREQTTAVVVLGGGLAGRNCGGEAIKLELEGCYFQRGVEHRNGQREAASTAVSLGCLSLGCRGLKLTASWRNLPGSGGAGGGRACYAGLSSVKLETRNVGRVEDQRDGGGRTMELAARKTRRGPS